jgi:uncharacterized membrane protein YgaE (UPF0421/DUF939 family)
LPIVQASLAAGLAWLVATTLIGHTHPFFAPIAAVISLGVSHNERLRRGVELMAGVVVGLAIAELLIAVIGSGPWQIALVVALAMSVAVLVDGGPLMTVQAAASAVLVAALLPGGGFTRALDALVGAVIGLGVAALLPGDPIRAARRGIGILLSELDITLTAVANALRDRDEAAVIAALSRVRDTQPQVDDLRKSVQAGEEIATIAPLRRRRLAELKRIEVAAVRADYALRNARVLARRALAALRDGEPVPGQLADRLDEAARAARLLSDELGRGADPDGARRLLLKVAARLGDSLLRETGFSGRVVVAQLRSVVLDLLQATGMPRADAAAALPPLPAT